MAGLNDKDRRHYGMLDREEVIEVTPEQAWRWLNTRPPPPWMWSRGGANNEKARRYADSMAAGEWDNDRDVEPVMIDADHEFIRGGHHRLTAVTLIGRPQPLRVRFYTKPTGWDKRLEATKMAERKKNKPASGEHYHVTEENGIAKVVRTADGAVLAGHPDVGLANEQCAALERRHERQNS